MSQRSDAPEDGAPPGFADVILELGGEGGDGGVEILDEEANFFEVDDWEGYDEIVQEEIRKEHARSVKGN